MSDNTSKEQGVGAGAASSESHETSPESNSRANGELAQQISDEVESRMRPGSGQESGQSSGKRSGQHDQTGSGSDDELVQQVGDEMERRMRSGRLGHVEQEVEEAQRDMKLHHRVLYGSVVFFAVVLVWYGLDELIPEVPILESGLGAVIGGVLLLLISGSLFKSLFGVYLPTK